MKPLLVLDKSYLCAASTAEVQAICDNSCALMPEELLFELITGDLQTRTQCFRKFPCRENPVELIPSVAFLIGFEKETRNPSTPLRKRRLLPAFTFNAKLATGEFELTEKHERGVALWRDRLARDVDGLIENGSSADRMFPDLLGLLPGQRIEVVENLVKRFASDAELVRQFYAGLASPEYPPSSIVGRTWAVFRRAQVYATASIEYFAKYGGGVNKTSREKLENECSDLNYLVTAVLAGALATGDKTMARRFKLLCPKGGLAVASRPSAESK